MKKKILGFILVFALMFSVTACGGDDSKSDEAHEELWSAIYDAYVFALPLMIEDATAQVSTNTKEVTNEKAPINQIFHADELVDASFTDIVTPNVDTIYSQGFIDLSEEAYVLILPEVKDRFFSVEIMDAYTNARYMLGSGGDYEGETNFAMTYHDPERSTITEVPDGLTELEMPTANGWILIRTLVEDDADIKNVKEIQKQISFIPLHDAYLSSKEYVAPEGEFDEHKQFVPSEHILEMGPEEYFTIANSLLEKNPPAKVPAALDVVNVGAGKTFDISILGDSYEEDWAKMQKNLPANLMEHSIQYMTTNAAWQFFGYPVAEFDEGDSTFEYRALVALEGLGANPVDIAIYPKAEKDDKGEELNGKNKYVIHFEKDALPPTEEQGFWSITAYGEDKALIDNPIDKYLINDRSDYIYNADGSLDIFVQKEAPNNPELEVNWLPVDNEVFHLYMRVYLPAKEAMDGTWKAPSITKISN